MSKRISLLLSIWCTVGALYAQEPSVEQKKSIFANADQVMSAFAENQSLCELGGKQPSFEITQQFISLFAAGATVYDGLGIERDADGFYPRPFVTVERPVTEYTQLLKTNYAECIRVRHVRSIADYSKINSGELHYFIERQLNGKTKDLWNITATDTIEVVAQFALPSTDVKIARVSKVGAKISCDQCPAPPDKDSDGDGVPDRIDRCPDEKGTAKNQGCPEVVEPDSDGDGVPDRIDRCPDLKGTAKNQGCPPDADGDGIYDYEDQCPNKPGPRENKGCPLDRDGDGVVDAKDKCPDAPGPVRNEGCPLESIRSSQFMIYAGVGAGSLQADGLSASVLDDAVYSDKWNVNISDLQKATGTFAYHAGIAHSLLFGNATKVGFSYGLQYTSLSGTLAADHFSLNYGSHDAEATFIRQLRVRQISEDWKVNSLGMPLLAEAQFRSNESVRINVGAGPVIWLSNTVKSAGSATGTFEQIRQVDQSLPNHFFFSPITPIDEDDWLLTEAAYAGHYASDIQALFDARMAAGYDVGLNRALSGEGKETYQKTRLGFLLHTDVEYELSKSKSICAGIQYLGARFSREEKKYVMVNSVHDAYNTLARATTVLKTSQIRINIGLKFNF